MAAAVSRRCLGSLLGLIFLLAGCGEPGDIEVACDESLKRGQCSKCLCLGAHGQCREAPRCAACRPPYAHGPGGCAARCAPSARPAMPRNALELNGLEWPTACWNGTEEQHFLVIGDWGGILSGSEPLTFKNRPTVIEPIDSHAQSYVARKMAQVADEKRPKFVVNVGDNFYPGGISSPGTCNAETDKTDAAGEIIFKNIFEKVYQGVGLAVEWWGVLGNHDYGGYHYNVHWDQNIFYTWHAPESRWLTPALYWKRTAQFRNFSAEFFFVDSNKVDTYGNPDADPEHNICSRSHNQPPQALDCNGTKITGPDSCWTFFDDLWKEQKAWLAKQLESSKADWQIVVTHYPPYFEPCRSDVWETYLAKYGVDLYISGHTHLQNVSYMGSTPYIISGGGGGITSEILPTTSGHDDGYGFMDVVLQHDAMYIYRYSHGGVENQTIIRGVNKILPQSPQSELVVM